MIVITNHEVVAHLCFCGQIPLNHPVHLVEQGRRSELLRKNGTRYQCRNLGCTNLAVANSDQGWSMHAKYWNFCSHECRSRAVMFAKLVQKSKPPQIEDTQYQQVQGGNQPAEGQWHQQQAVSMTSLVDIANGWDATRAALAAGGATQGPLTPRKTL